MSIIICDCCKHPEKNRNPNSSYCKNCHQNRKQWRTKLSRTRHTNLKIVNTITKMLTNEKYKNHKHHEQQMNELTMEDYEKLSKAKDVEEIEAIVNKKLEEEEEIDNT